VETIVSSVVGPGHARVQINADFDVNRITQTSDKFDPEGRVVRSSQTREEQSATSDNKEGTVSVGTELPGGRPQTEGAAKGDQSKKTEEIVNYEISRTTKTEVIEAGRVNRISAAVLVDGIYAKNDKGELAYQPRPKEEIDRIAALVRSAIGFDTKRGDQVEVVNLRFAETTPSPINEPTGWMNYLQFTKDDIMRGAEFGVMAVLGLVVMFMVVRPLVRRIITPEGMQPGQALAAAAVSPSAEAATAGGMGIPGVGGSITSTGGPNVSIVGGDEAVAISNRTSAMIDIAKVQGQVHAQSVQKVGELADKNPHEAVSIIRNWLHEDAA
jgi:flagellar M-ring protein FliF